MIQDEYVSPGYCLLQELRNDAPLPVNIEIDQHSYRDRMGRVLLKNTFASIGASAEAVVHGPAQSEEGLPGFMDNDYVAALPLKSWSNQARQWIDLLSGKQWPTDDMKQYCKNTRCFVVGTGRKGSANEQLEWRMSSSLVERCLMFNLNITQVRCYVLMKMIMRTFITKHVPDSISSFMCKTVLLHCICNTNSNAWQEHTLVKCLLFCLLILYNCVSNENCPHFIVTHNNLMRGCFSQPKKQKVLEKLHYVISSNESALLEVECDQLGLRIENSITRIQEIIPEEVSIVISGQLVKTTATALNSAYAYLLEKTNEYDDTQSLLQTLSTYVFKLLHRYYLCPAQDKLAIIIYAKQLCITLGSVTACTNINSQIRVTRASLTLMSFGLDSDVASGKLKLASVYYFMGDIPSTELILTNIEECYDPNAVEPICGCHNFLELRNAEFNKLCFESRNEYLLFNNSTASCVRFLRHEIKCCPYELQFEMFRSTQLDLQQIGEDDDWMNWALVDCLPYLYFLQYKIYSNLKRREDKQRTLSNLACCIKREANLGHRDTALNLLGQCMEQENRINVSFDLYLLSLKIRERNNAANLHICRLLSALTGNHLQ